MSRSAALEQFTDALVLDVSDTEFRISITLDVLGDREDVQARKFDERFPGETAG